jgi:putative transcriptional regulator
MAVRHRRARRGDRRGERDRAGDQGGQLDAYRLGGLAPGGSRGHLARLQSPLPAPPSHPGWVRYPKAMKNKVRTLRMQKGLAQGQLAEAMEVSRQTINSIENERYTPSLPLALALARFFGVTVEEMFDDQEL